MVLSMERWVGKVAIVTGASSGIGAGLVVKLVEEGLVVVGLARRIDKMQEAALELSEKRGSFHPIKCDVSVEEEILAAFQYITENLGPIHILINNAGIGKFGNLTDDNTTEMWKEIINVNLLGLCICTREAVKDMNKNNVNGHIIHVNSTTGHRTPSNSTLNIYPATKFAVGALAHTLRHEFNRSKTNIKITSLSPGVVLTDIFSSAGMSFDDVKEKIGGELPYMESEDIADAAVYILSTPPNVMVGELTMRPIFDIIMD